MSDENDNDMIMDQFMDRNSEMVGRINAIVLPKQELVEAVLDEKKHTINSNTISIRGLDISQTDSVNILNKILNFSEIKKLDNAINVTIKIQE
jgi:hypothetical protein